jgi:hypothetical protein
MKYIVISKIVSKMVYGQPYKKFPKKSPIYKFQLLVIGINMLLTTIQRIPKNPPIYEFQLLIIGINKLLTTI